MVQIAILGLGVVGSGVADVISRNAQAISGNARHDIQVKYILDIRDFKDSPYADKMIRDFAVAEKDPEVRVVVETIGGVGAALDFTRRALSAGKHVVTSNKELVAGYGDELLALAYSKNVNYLFEASVGGGIPIIRPISQCLAANNLQSVCGILNGTTNFIFSRMEESGLSFQQALAEAQAKGYAESNPADDIEGKDTCRKICILASLCFGSHVYPASVQTQGIDKLTTFDLQYAQNEGFCVKLLGQARRQADKTVCAWVAPHLVPAGHPLASVRGVYNGIVVTGDAIGQVMFYGQGAGALPTASAVVADIIDAVKHFSSHKYLSWGPGAHNDVTAPTELISRWYLRTDRREGLLTPPVCDGLSWAAEQGLAPELALRVLEEN